MATTSEIQVTEAYIGLLGRAPDPAGLAYWTAQLDDAVAAGQTASDALKKLTNDITLSAEWDSGIGVNDATTQAGAEAVVTAMYDNLFDREATASDLAYWSAELVNGTTTASEMAVQLIVASQANANTTDADVLGFKQQAATYYVETVAQDDFDRGSAQTAVINVNGPISLSDSKALTDSIATGLGNTIVLTTATNTAAMTGGDDTVTGVIGDTTTYQAADTVNDLYTNDNDSLTITSNAGFTFGSVSKVESVNVDLAKPLGTEFDIVATSLLGGTLTITTAATVPVAGVDVAATREIDVENVSSNVVLVGVETADIDMNDSNTSVVTISGDSSLTTLDVSAANDAGAAITMANDTAVTITVDGLANSGNDSISISANNAVALDLDSGNGDGGVEFITLSGNTNDVVYTISDTGDGSDGETKFTLEGTHDVTVAASAADLTGTTLINNATGTTTIKVNAGASDLDIGEMNDVSMVDFAADMGGDTVTLDSGHDVKFSIDQTDGTVTFADDDASNDATLAITVDAGTDNTIDIGGIAATDFASISISGATDTITGLSFDGTGGNDTALTIVSSNDVSGTTIDTGVKDFTTNTDALTLTTIAAKDISLTSSNDVTTQGITAADGGSLVITATNDVSVTGNIDINNADSDAGEDVTITAAEIDVTGTIQTNDLSLTATNDAAAAVSTLGGNITANGTMTLSDGNFDINANVASTGLLTISGATQVDISGTTTATAGAVITSSKTVDLGTQFIGSVLNGGSATNDITANLTGVDAAATIITGSGNDSLTVNAAQIHTITTNGGLDSLTITALAATSSISTGADNDTIDDNETSVAFTVDLGAGDDVYNVVNGSDAVVDFGEGSADKLVLAAGDISGDGSIYTNVEIVDITAGDVTMSTTQFSNDSTFTLQDTDNGGDEILLITGTAATGETVNASGVIHDVNALTLVNITTGAGNDVITGTAGANVITAGGGVDNINAGNGGDTIVIASTAESQNDVINGGLGTDTMSVTGTTIFDDVDANIVSVETITMTAGDKNLTIAGQTEAFTINAGTGANVVVSGSGNDTIDADAGADTITGGAGNDSIALGGTDTVADTVIFSSSATNGVDTITEFETANDVIDGLDEAADGTGNGIDGNGYLEVDISAAGADVTLADGLTVLEGIDYTGDVTDMTAVAAFLADYDGGGNAVVGNGVADEAAYIIIEDDGNVAYIYYYNSADTAAAISDDELTLLGSIDVDDASTFSAANFDGFG